jgi:PadR family transcriptional regulator, regulatory protein PadR
MSMRRKPGVLLPLELAILRAAIRLWRTGTADFHGYEIARHVADESERRSLTAYGTLYRALSRLETMGFLESQWEDPQIAARENRPGRRLYVLTGNGVTAAQQATPPAGSGRIIKRKKRRVLPA